MNNDIIPLDKLPEETRAIVVPIVQQFSACMERAAQDIHIMSQRITDLEKQVRLQKPLSVSQEKYINGAIRKRSAELLGEKGYAGDRKAVNKLSGVIRKGILSRYGIGSLREAPAYGYDTMMEEAQTWKDFVILKEIAKEAAKRAEERT